MTTIIIKTVFTVLQALIIFCVSYTVGENKSDKVLIYGLITYLVLITGVMWLK